MNYRELYDAVCALVPGRTFSISPTTWRHVGCRGESVDVTWEIYVSGGERDIGASVEAQTAELALGKLREELVKLTQSEALAAMAAVGDPPANVPADERAA